MFTRTTLALGLLLVTASFVDAQSNVRPASRLVRVPEMGASYLASDSPWARRWKSSEPETYPTNYVMLPSLPKETERREFTHLELGLEFHPEAAFERGGGGVAISRAAWAATLGERVGDESVYAFTLEAEASFYDFRSAGSLMAGAGDPFNDVYDTRLGVAFMEDPSKSSSWFSSVQLGLSGEDNAQLRDAFSLGLAGGIRHQVGEDLSLSLGFIGRTRLEDTPWLFPYLGFDWRIADRFRLTSTGSAVAAICELSDTLELGLGAEYGTRQFRLNQDSSLPGGVINDEEITASGSLGWRPSRRITLELEAGVTVWREFSSYDSGGTKLTELESDLTEFGALRLSVTL